MIGLSAPLRRDRRRIPVRAMPGKNIATLPRSADESFTATDT